MVIRGWFISDGVVITTSGNVCKTYGSGVFKPFNGSAFYVRTSCPATLTQFTHRRVMCLISILRGDTGLMTRVEIVVNNIRTIIQNGTISVETRSVSLPYDHTYQHIFQYGIYTKLKSKVLPLSITWYNAGGGISSIWVILNEQLVSEMAGFCGRLDSAGCCCYYYYYYCLAKSINFEMFDAFCIFLSFVFFSNVCRDFMSQAVQCLQSKLKMHLQLCENNAFGYRNSTSITCAFFKEIALQCGPNSSLWRQWRRITGCSEPKCPANFTYQELGNAFQPTCSNPTTRITSEDLVSTCSCPNGKVLNDHAEDNHCLNVTACPCVHGSKSYTPGAHRQTKCQKCLCMSGKWQCSKNMCLRKCVIESQFVTSFDGRQYSLPRKCTYVAAQGANWTLSIHFSERAVSIKQLDLNIFQYVFSDSSLVFGTEEINDFHQTGESVFLCVLSSIYVQVQTFFGMNIQVRMLPEIQMYVSLPQSEKGKTQGLCGNYNDDSTDDFTTSSGIIENSAEQFALSWAMDGCGGNISKVCINLDNEFFADEKCFKLRDPNGLFSECHDHVPLDPYIQCTTGLQSCLCVALGNYAKACANQGITLGDWRASTNCTLTCEANQVFNYNTQACNETCRSLSGLDPTCVGETDPVEGCGCPKGTHLQNQGSRRICSPRSLCHCHYPGGTTPPGPSVVDGRPCNCEDGRLNCSEDCGCSGGKVCVHCSYLSANTTLRTCESLSRPVVIPDICESGCYCPDGLYEDHRGECVPVQNCTCVFAGKVYGPGQTVESNCKTCICNEGYWICSGEPCQGKCQLYGNGHYQTFDSKWYHFDGNCQYTLVEDDCGSGIGMFTVKVESIPCCDEALICSRTITVDLPMNNSLILSDMRVQTRHHSDLMEVEPMYYVHTVGLYIIVSIPRIGLTLIWDKHTRVTVHLEGKVCGLCGNFDASETNDLLSRGSSMVSSTLEFANSWKSPTLPCSDQIDQSFPCQRHSYCANWAERRCMILRSDTFRDCHLKVDPEPYYQACVLESCSCEFEGKFLGFCTAVAAYAEACSEQNVCIKWRTPDLCPVYCDFYNEEGQYSWHYEPCGHVKACLQRKGFSSKLEGCYPRCPKEAPYYDENTKRCTTQESCTCLFNYPKTSNTINPMGQISTYEALTHRLGASTASSTATSTEQTTINVASDSTSIVKSSLTSSAAAKSTTDGTTTHANPNKTTAWVSKCKDLQRNQSWTCGMEWTEDCFHKICRDGKIEMTTVSCPEMQLPDCPRGQIRKISDGCCETMQCDCRCDVYGDPHYISFQGTSFDFLDNCTYVLVKEDMPRHNFSIVVDNYFCIPELDGSCIKGITLKYHNNTITLTIVESEFNVAATLNGATLQLPYEEQGIRFETTGVSVSVYFREIRSEVSLTPFNTLVITLALEHFQGNTLGQCGVCGGSSCVRPNGQTEDESCCDKTAYDWIHDDPLKPYCKEAQRNVPCHTDNPVTPVPPVFQQCRDILDFDILERNCKYDVCLSKSHYMACSTLQQAVEQCKQAGICVEWRHLTNGTCTIQCPPGLLYSECRGKLDDFCNGGVKEDLKAGCFCPDNQIRAEEHKDICVNECTNCKGPWGEPKELGETWESNCQLCTCNNYTRSVECRPNDPVPAPTCRPNFVLVPGCCNNPMCGKNNYINICFRTCQHNGLTFKVQERWTDASDPCLSFSCTTNGTEMHKRECPQQSCHELARLQKMDLTVFGLIAGNNTCSPELAEVNVTVDNCTGLVKLPVCAGECRALSRCGKFYPIKLA
uniref:VWFD domain-containing protein n=1 Tax=Denticeps clupeoides TaxID=299321 RepID=A0AAY4BJQ2_9TELE